MAKKRSGKYIIRCFVFLLIILGMVSFRTENTQAASRTAMKKTYKQYLKKHVSKNKKYAIVNIGEKNKPALLIA